MAEKSTMKARYNMDKQFKQPTFPAHVWQLDCWRYDGDWTVNNKFRLSNIRLPESWKLNPNAHKLFRVLRDAGYLPSTWETKAKFTLDRTDEWCGLYMVCRANSMEPVFMVQIPE